MRYPIWLKRLLLPFEFDTHALHYDHAKAQSQSEEDQDEAMRAILGDEFVDRMNNF